MEEVIWRRSYWARREFGDVEKLNKVSGIPATAC